MGLGAPETELSAPRSLSSRKRRLGKPGDVSVFVFPIGQTGRSWSSRPQQVQADLTAGPNCVADVAVPQRARTPSSPGRTARPLPTRTQSVTANRTRCSVTGVHLNSGPFSFSWWGVYRTSLQGRVLRSQCAEQKTAGRVAKAQEVGCVQVFSVLVSPPPSLWVMVVHCNLVVQSVWEHDDRNTL